MVLHLLLLLLLLVLSSNAQSPSRSLDALLQHYAYRSFLRPRILTGTPYDAPSPSNLTGITLSALRLRSGSLRSKGFNHYNEFQIPIGVVGQPYVERLVLVYQSLGNWSLHYYPLEGYTYLTPVLGLLAYEYVNSTDINLPELDVQAQGNPILVNFGNVGKVPDGFTAKCVWFDLDGSKQFNDTGGGGGGGGGGNVCSTLRQGHFAIVVEGNITAPSPAPSLPNLPPPPTRKEAQDNDDKSKVWIIVGSVVGGFALLVLLGLLALWMQRYKSKNKMQQMEKAAEVGEALHMASVGNTRAPVAMGTRTQPVLENEYVP